ncbi:MAG: lysophospholipid acyltransferase family protein, partial [Myxococcales bacterium]|nr:lysophospholipid acyltransferase family protein [Myxococcales bacterium]
WISGRGGGAAEHARIEAASAPGWAAAIAAGRGVVVAASHTGNWDLAACAIARHVDLLVVTRRLRVRGIDAFWQRTRAAQGVHLTGAEGAMRRARDVLRGGGAVAMMIDQVPLDLRRAIEAPFLGRTAWVDRAPAALAAAAGAPLVVAASRRDADGDQALTVLEVLEPPPRAPSAWIAQATRAANERLEAFVRAHPSEWLWLHRRWRRAGPAPAARPRARLGLDARGRDPFRGELDVM